MNRREFVVSSVALTGWAAMAPGLRAEVAMARKMKIALVPGSIGVVVKSQPELNALAHRHRFEAVEPRTEEIAAMSPVQQAELKADLAAKGLAWAAAGLTVDFRKDDTVFRAGMAKLPALAAALQAVGATRVGTWISPSNAQLTYRENFRVHAVRLAEIARVLEAHGVRLGLEYVGTQLSLVGGRYPFLHTMAEARELIAEIGVRNVGLVLDSWHWWQAGDKTEDILALKNSDVVSVDLNDAPTGLAKGQQKDGERELPLATGVIDLAGFLRALAAIGYDGPMRAEPFNKAVNALENEPACQTVSEAMWRSVALLKS